MIAIIVGVPGTGKTSVAKRLSERGWKVVSFGSFMFEIAKEKGIKNRDDLRNIPSEEYVVIQEKAAEKIVAIGGNVLIDTHCSVLKPAGYFPGLPHRILKMLKPGAIITIEAAPQDIGRWRANDNDMRVREGNAAEHQQINRYFAAAYSALTGAPISFVKNEEGKLDETVKKAAKILGAVQANG